MNRNERESDEQNRTYRGREREPEHLKSRERMRQNRDQNYPHKFHEREKSYRAQREAQRENSEFKKSLDDSGWDNTPGGELNWEEQYKTDGEARNYRGKLARNNSNYTFSEYDYSGFGPRGYTRSDARIQDEVSELLSRDHYIDASDIVVAVENHIVKLSGTVRQREDRVEAEMLAESVIGVDDIQNDITVRKGRHH